MRVDDAFVTAVRKEAGYHDDDRGIIEATLAVAAERGMVVPEGAPRMWAIKSSDGIEQVCAEEDTAIDYRLSGETVVRVAIVEIKE